MEWLSNPWLHIGLLVIAYLSFPSGGTPAAA